MYFFIICINSSKTILRICYNVLLDIENQNIELLLNKKNLFFWYTDITPNRFK